MDKYESEKAPYKSTFFAVVVCECVLALLLILTALSMKFFFPKSFSAAKKWYIKNITVDTNIKNFMEEIKDEN